MTKLLLTALTLATAVIPAAAIAAPERTFTRDGETYIYTSAQESDRVILTGRSVSSGSSFRLIIRGNSVTGVSGGVPVAFTYPNAQAKLKVTEVAAR